ncbi:MAG: PEP-CTERM sorting domain-containing protein [Caldimonas sp.]
MRNHFPLVAALSVFAGVAFTTGTAQGAVLYDNGPYNGQASSAAIVGNNYATDSFAIGASSTVNGVEFVAWDFAAPDTTVSVGWAIYSGTPKPYTASPLIASGTSLVTDTFLLNNAKGYGVYSDTFSTPGLTLAAGTYSLALYSAVASNPNDNVYWDTNSGPSTAVIHTAFGPFEGFQASQSFQVLGSIATVSPVPEPETYALLLAGLGAVGMMSRRRKR